MKALALLTMVFLPGTLCATLFATPFLDFSAPSTRFVVNDRFWVYWVILLPLTAGVLFIFFIFLLFVEWKRSRESLAAGRGKSG